MNTQKLIPKKSSYKSTPVPDIFQTPICYLENSFGQIGLMLFFFIFLAIAAVVITISPYRQYLGSSGDTTFGTVVVSLLLAGLMVWVLGLLEILRRRLQMTIIGFSIFSLAIVAGLILLVMLRNSMEWWRFCLLIPFVIIIMIALASLFEDAVSQQKKHQKTYADNDKRKRPPGLEFLDDVFTINENHSQKESLKKIFWDKERLIADEKQETLHAQQKTRRSFYESEATRLKMKKLRHLIEIEELQPYIFKYLFGEDFDPGDDSNLDDLFNR